ncbi:MAG: hypothetical protein BGO78_12055 [Chloroflexi bacterium 44-23]|nr:MAG: hypothetical protein BGO78_12055 [Chloroflexi bacterium 44-23]
MIVVNLGQPQGALHGASHHNYDYYEFINSIIRPLPFAIPIRPAGHSSIMMNYPTGEDEIKRTTSYPAKTCP